MKTLLSALTTTILALAVLGTLADEVPQKRQISIAIESKTLADALDQWAQQTGYQIFVQDWKALKRMRAPSVKGRYTAQEALDKLLERSSLTCIWLNDRAVSIRTGPSEPARTKVSPASGKVQVLPSSVHLASGGSHAAGAYAMNVVAWLCREYRKFRV